MSVVTKSGASALRQSVADSAPGLKKARSRRARRTLLTLAAISLVCLGLFACNVLLGSFTVTIPDFFAILFGKNIRGATFIVMENKLPRSVLGVLVGAAFGISGAIFQSLLRNPLASPDVIGISSGASAFAVVAIVMFGASGVPVSLIAIAGALIVATVIFLLSYRNGQAAGGRLILMGIGVSAMMGAVVTFLLQRADVNKATDAYLWMTGSLNSSSWQRISALCIGLLIVLPFVAALARRLRALQLGDDLAAGLGVNVNRTRLFLVLSGVLLAALATAAAGPIAFVAFLAGPIARRLLGGRVSLTAAALVGACITLAADYIGAYMLGNVTMPVGVITGAAGAPFLLYLLIMNNKGARA